MPSSSPTYAVVEDLKIYVGGGFWDRLSVPEFPASAFLSVVAMIHVPWGAYVEVEGPGDFSFILRVDGVEIDYWPLRVVRADPRAAASPASGPSGA